MTKEELKLENPWNEVANIMAKTNRLWYNDIELVCEKDRDIVKEYNSKVKEKNSKATFELRTPPFPFAGNVLEAKIIILSLNPGYVDTINKYAALGVEKIAPEKATEISKTQQEFLKLNGKAIYDTDYEEDKIIGGRYWETMLKEIRELYQKQEDVYKDFAVIQLYGYSSSCFKPLACLKKMESYKFLKKLLKYLCEKPDGPMFLAMRQTNDWSKLLTEAFGGTIPDGRFIAHNSYRGIQYVTKNNLKENFDFVIKRLGLC